MKIGQLAALADVRTATVRYYERIGLIAEPQRSPSGYRQYGPETAERIRFIKRAQDLGFSLEEIEELLELRADDPESCAAVEQRTHAKIADVNRRIADLQRLRGVLTRLATLCGERTPTSECPVLEMMSQEGPGHG